jgi:SulP family sulfate permease
VIVRLDAPLYFANAAYLTTRVRALVDARRPRAVIVDAGAVHDIDTSALDSLRELVRELRERGVDLHLADVKGPVRDTLARAGFVAELGPDRFSFTVHGAVRRACDLADERCDPRVLQAWAA